MPTSIAPTSTPPTTLAPWDLPRIACGRIFRSPTNELVVRAWVEDGDGIANEVVTFDHLSCSARLFDEHLAVREVSGEPDGLPNVVRFVFPEISAKSGHAYLIRLRLVRADSVDLGESDFNAGTF